MLKLKNQGNTCYINSIIQIMNNLNIKHDYKYRPNNNFRRYEQNDQHDFLLFLLDYINETTAKKHKIPLIESDLDNLKKKGLKNLYNIGLTINNYEKGFLYISDIIDFIGQRITQIRCNNCNNIKYKFDVFKILELNIPPIPNPTIYDCLNYTFNSSMIDNYNCNKCKKTSNAAQSTLFWRMPKILSILFVRNFYINNQSIKNNTDVQFLENLELNKYYAYKTDKKYTYNLNSIAYHHGNANYGHCTSICKYKNKWFNCDDDTINEIKTFEIKNAYILFYIINPE